ncbi:MAG: MFS transporter [Rhizobiaceae bacterium]|nr:MFS transporter [Rhizobiaceae bacterium]
MKVGDMNEQQLSASGQPLTHVSKRGIWGWMFFDWSAQPFHTLLITFVFARYFAAEVAPNPATGQIWWGYMLAVSGILIAVLSPVLGSIADATGPRKPWIAIFTVMSIIGTAFLWYAVPGGGGMTLWILVAFGIGMIGVEFAAVFNNAIMPDLVTRDTLGRLSGSAWALGYVGGLVALIFVLTTMVESSPGSGSTIIGIAPILGLDQIVRGGERAVGPLTSIWFRIFIIPFFLFTPDVTKPVRIEGAIRKGLSDLLSTLRNLPKNQSLFAYLGSSMFYRDALNGLYGFGGIYAGGVLKWEAIQLGLFGILAAFTGALGAWLGGRLDEKFGPKKVITFSVIVLIIVCIMIVTTDRQTLLTFPIEEVSGPFAAPDILFYICGALIGAAGGALQAASRTLMVDQAEGGDMTQAFGLYALSGKATSFIAPAMVAFFTGVVGQDMLGLSDSAAQRFGISPLIALFAIGLVLLMWVKQHKNVAGPQGSGAVS